jgi:prepilin-type processing-associated H-X9-DG protein
MKSKLPHPLFKGEPSGPRSHPSPHAPHGKGFTLVEILVVIVIVIVLAGVALTISKNASRSATKVADMNNLRSLAAAVMAAGGDNAGRLPKIHNNNSAPYWIVGRATLESYGIYKEACYIPRKGVVGGAPNYDWWFKIGSDTQVPVHYVYFANDAQGAETPWFQQGNLTPPTKAEYRGAIPYETIITNPSKAFPKNFTDDAWYNVLWAGLVRDYPGSDTVAAVVDNQGKPLGMNIMYLDGHVEWKDARSTKVRYTTNQGLKVFW